MNYVLKCSSCGLEIPVEPIVARMMQNNCIKGQSFCSSCGASDCVTLVRSD